MTKPKPRTKPAVDPQALQVKPPGSEPLTDQLLAFVDAYVSNGGNTSAAAKTAGLPDLAAASSAIADPRVREQVDLRRDAQIKTAGATKAWQVIEQLMTDPASPAQVKFQAAKWTLEASGHGLAAAAASLKAGMKKNNDPLTDMTVYELQDFIKRGRRALENIKDVAAGDAIDVTPKADT